MMKPFTIIVLITSLCLVACNDCRNEDCPANRRFQFEVKNPAGKSLFGSTRFPQNVDNDSIKVVGLDQSNNETDLSIRQVGATLSFQPILNSKNYFIKYSFAKTDSLTFEFIDTYSSPCCNLALTEYLVQVNSNGILISSEVDSTFLFKK